MFAARHRESHTPPVHPSDVAATIAPQSSSVVAHATFPSGQSSNTSLDYTPTPHEQMVTSNPDPPTSLSPHPLPSYQAPLPHLPPPRTAPTVFITSTTATSEPSPFPLITVGPVLGLVTHSTARVLIECNTAMTVHTRLTLIERHCRRTRANRGKVGDPSLHSVDVTTKGAASPVQDGHSKTNGHRLEVESDAVQSQEFAIMTGMSSGSPVNGAPPSVAPPAMRTQEAAIMTGASSGSPVNGASATPLSPQASSSPSTYPHPSHGSPGTTIGRADAAVEGATSTETHPAPATGPSPTEAAQREGTADPTQPTDGAGTFAPSTVAGSARHGVGSGPFNRDASSAPVQGEGSAESLMSHVEDGHVVDKDVECTAHRVATVTFTGLQPDCRYELTFLNVKSRVTSTITTLIEGWTVSEDTPFNVAFVSCNMVAVTKDLALPESDLWLDLSRRAAAHELDYVLHIGDQIYADEKRDNEGDKAKDYQLVFMTGVNMITDLPTSDWPACAVHIKELYRQLYRETWSHPPTAFVLANCPSLMIYDDHDFRDDWGNSEADSDPNSKEFYVGRCAQEVMCEYQRQLWDNVDFKNIDQIKKDFHMHVFGEHGIVFLDVRGPRSLHKIENEPYPYMGSLQWQEVKDALSPVGVMQDVKSLLMICPAPIVFLPTSINDFLGHSVIDDALGHWSSKPFKAEQQQMLNLCQAWKAAAPGREVTFIGGDVHVGGHSEIMRDGVVIFQQFVTSAIANYRLSQFEFFMGQLSQDLITTLEDGWGFKHRGFTRQRNYGLMQVAADDVGPLVKRRLVTPKGEKPEADNRRGTAHLK